MILESESSRRRRLWRRGTGAALLTIAALMGLIAIGCSGSAEGEDSTHAGNRQPHASGEPPQISGAREVDRMLRGIPQYGLILGDEEAPVELIEFGDLQCQGCRRYAEKILPPIIEGPVRKGQVKLAYCNFVKLGDQSAAAGTAALAAGEESRGWHYLELFYRNQGEEGSGYADEQFLRAVAKAAGVKHMDSWDKRRKASEFEPGATTELAQSLGLSSIPSFAIRGPGTESLKPLGTLATTRDIEKAIVEAS
jgi:protein-disulfide isomerase